MGKKCRCQPLPLPDNVVQLVLGFVAADPLFCILVAFVDGFLQASHKVLQ